MIDAARASGDPLEHRADSVLGEHVPRCGRTARAADYTATQNMAEWFMENEPDWMTALWSPTRFCFPACTATRARSRSSTSSTTRSAAMSSIARSQYNALQLSLRKRWSHGYQFDVNYTLAHAWTMVVGRDAAASSTTIRQRRLHRISHQHLEPDQQYADADFDIRHQINVNWVAELPFGHGKPIGKDVTGLRQRVHRRLVGGGHLAVDERLPVQRRRTAARAGRRTGTSRATPSLVDPGVLPATGTTKDAVNGLPSPFTDPTEALDVLPA